jgi:MFS family permease
MKEETLKKIRLVAIMTSVAVGIFAFVYLYDRTFPQAAIDVSVSKSEANNIAKEFISKQGVDISEYKTAMIFNSNDDAVVYLQKTLGLEKANEVMKSETAVWFWSFRAFRSLQKEEYNISIDPASGKLVSFDRAIEEDAGGADLELKEAKKIAEDFIDKNAIGINFSDYDLVDSSSEKKKSRTDHHFEWKNTRRQIGEGEFRILADVQGDIIGSYSSYFKVPEKFSREFEKESSVGDLLSTISLAFMFAIFVAAFIIFIKKYKTDSIKWKFALMMAVLLFLLGLADMVNTIPMAKFMYYTEIGYGTFWGMSLIGIIIVGVIYGIYVLFVTASGESLAQEIYPRSVEILTKIREKLFGKEIALSSFRGYWLASISLGGQALLFFIASKFFKVWYPADSPMSSIFDMYLPFLFPLTLGLTAAISEEFTFRLFGISFAKKYFKFTFLALLIPAIIWAFAHSDYPVFPVYFRGIELTLGGLLFGYFFIRYNILTCVIAHYIINAVLVSVPLLRSENNYYFISGLVVIGLGLIPALIGAVGLIKKQQETKVA